MDRMQHMEAPVEAEQTRSALYSAVLGSSIGRKMVAGISALSLGGGTAAIIGGEGSLMGGTATAAEQTTTVTQPGVTVEVHDGSASAHDVATKKVTFLMNNTVKGAKAEVKKAPNCHWTKQGEVWYNSYINSSGQRVWYAETTPAELCKSNKSSTGEVKVAGGETGRHCFNEAQENHKPKGKIVHGEIKVVSNFNQNVHLKAVAKAAVKEQCGTATAYASVNQNLHMSLKDYLKTTGSAQLSVAGKLYDKAEAKAEANVHCVDVTTTTPGTTTTETTTTNTTPTPVTPNLSVNHIQETYAGATNVVEATITNATVGDTERACFDADYGRFDTPCVEKVADSSTVKIDE